MIFTLGIFNCHHYLKVHIISRFMPQIHMLFREEYRDRMPAHRVTSPRNQLKNLKNTIIKYYTPRHKLNALEAYFSSCNNPLLSCEDRYHGEERFHAESKQFLFLSAIDVRDGPLRHKPLTNGCCRLTLIALRYSKLFSNTYVAVHAMDPAAAIPEIYCQQICLDRRLLPLL